jgi:hypothetical protein
MLFDSECFLELCVIAVPLNKRGRENSQVQVSVSALFLAAYDHLAGS